MFIFLFFVLVFNVCFKKTQIFKNRCELLLKSERKKTTTPTTSCSSGHHVIWFFRFVMWPSWYDNMAEVEASKSLSGLLNGIAQKVYYNNSDITEELLKTELYPDLSPEEFRALHDRMKSLLKVLKGPKREAETLDTWETVFSFTGSV